MMLVLVLASLIAVCAAQRNAWYAGECGVSKYGDAGEFDLPAGKIVGGTETKMNEFPWQVSVRTRSNQHFCGGVVINARWILTASHCVDGDVPGDLLIVVGDWTRNDANNAARASYNAETIIMHPQYNPNFYYNDIALVQTTAPIVFSQEVAPVCAPTQTNLYTHVKAQCSGWGTLSSGGACCPQTLQYTTMNITTNAVCAAAYTQYPVTADMICATDNIGSTQRDSCQCDSGGPLTTKETDGVFVLIGIVSWGIGCASGYPGVYSRVGEFVQWVSGYVN